MAGNDLKRLNRGELLDIIYTLRKNQDALEQMNADLKQQLEDRSLKISQVGSLAEASLAVTRIFDEAQAAADVYLNEIQRRAGGAGDLIVQTKQEADGPLSDARAQAGDLIAQAKQEADGLLSDARAQADKTLSDARRQAADILAAARREAADTIADAIKMAEELTHDAQELSAARAAAPTDRAAAPAVREAAPARRAARS